MHPTQIVYDIVMPHAVKVSARTTFGPGSGVLLVLKHEKISREDTKVILIFHFRMNIYHISVLISVLLLALIGCSKDDKNPDYIKEANCATVNADSNTYTLFVRGVMNASCATGGCHDASTASSGVNLSNYAGVKKAFESQNLLCSVNHGKGCSPMPKGGAKLSANVLNRLACWARNGYVE